MPLPAGLDPITAGRFGLWLLGKRNQRAAARRSVSVSRDYPRCLAAVFARLFAPWTIYEYPGVARILPHFCGVSEKTAHNWLYDLDPLPAKHAATLAAVARSREAEWRALADELEAYVRDRPAVLRGRAARLVDRVDEQV